MGVQILGLTQKGVTLARSPRFPNDLNFAVIHFLDRNNGQANRDTVVDYCFGGNIAQANVVLKNLKQNRIIAEA